VDGLDAMLARARDKVEWEMSRALATLTCADALARQGRRDEAQSLASGVLAQADDLEAKAPRSWRVAMVRRGVHDLRATWAVLEAGVLMQASPADALPCLEEAVRSYEAIAEGLEAARTRGATHPALPDWIAGSRKNAELLRAHLEAARTQAEAAAQAGD
jgi:hypothetical protein